MQVRLLKQTIKTDKDIVCQFEVWGDSHEPQAEGVLFGSGNKSIKPDAIPQEVAEAIWAEAEIIRDAALPGWRFHNQVAPLLKAKHEGQET